MENKFDCDVDPNKEYDCSPLTKSTKFTKLMLMIRSTNFCTKYLKDINATNKKLVGGNIMPLLDLGKFYPELKNNALVCVTEMNTKEEIDKLVEVLAKCQYNNGIPIKNDSLN